MAAQTIQIERLNQFFAARHARACIVAATAAGMFIGSTMGRDSVAPIIGNAADCVVKLYGKAAGREHGYGTGVIISPDGRIITTLSLMVSLRGVKVVLADGRRYEARLERTDEVRQLALLKIEATDLPYMTPHSAAHLEQGDSVIALGNWFKIADGHESVSVCKGIVSLRMPLAARRLAQDFDYQGDALILDAITANPGAAGGPLLDIEGHFVGLVGKVIESVHTNTRLNYAVPGEEVIAFLKSENAASARGASDEMRRPEARSGGETPSASGASDRTKKPYIGVRLARLGYRHVSAYVERVRPGSPAAKAGILPDDLILAIDGRRIADADAYEEMVVRFLPGQSAAFTLKRGPDILVVTVIVEAEP